MGKTLLVTGATGFVGGKLLRDLSLHRSYEKIFVLIRSGSEQTAQQRFSELIDRLFTPNEKEFVGDRLALVEGDLSRDGLGLSVEDRRTLVRRLNSILHAAASTRFVAPAEELEQQNLHGTERVLELAKQASEGGKDFNFHHVSTAYVAGQQRGIVDETHLGDGQTFTNDYERTKHQAEKLVQGYRTLFPCSIYRPSIVVGHSQNGFTPHFRVLYWPLRLFASGLYPVYPLKRGVKVDIVPIDYVCAAILALMHDSQSIGKTFHLTAGIGREVAMERLLADVSSAFDVPKRPVIPYWLYLVMKHTLLRVIGSKAYWQATKKAQAYSAYFLGKCPQFDARATCAALARLGVEQPSWDQFSGPMLAFCRRTQFGESDPGPEHQFYAPKTQDAAVI